MREKYTGRVEPHILSKIDNFTNVKVNERKLKLTWNRFDLAFKLIYLNLIVAGQKSEFRRSCYKEHIKAFSLGSYNEFGNTQKNSFEEFERAYSELVQSYKDGGFDSKKSLIPLSSDGSILNGAHRTSLSIYLNTPVITLNTEIPPAKYNYTFFKKRGVSLDALDFAAQTFADYDETSYLAFVWPAANGFSSKIEDSIGKIVYKKTITLTAIGAHNLLSAAYRNESWLGDKTKNYPGVIGKLAKCFPKLSPVRVFLFQADEIEQVLKIKEEIRSIFNIGKHSVHITDNSEETRRLSRIVFNKNSLHFINNAKPNKYPGFDEKINYFKEEIYKHGLTLGNYVLDSGMVMGAYGIRSPDDIDYLTDSRHIHADLIDHHVECLTHHDALEVDLVDDPSRHFYYEDVKLISLHQLYKMKTQRRNNKDIYDISKINGLIQAGYTENYVNQCIYSLRFILARSHNIINRSLMVVLKKMGIYDFSRKIYIKYIR